jgi:hypothetical protein
MKIHIEKNYWSAPNVLLNNKNISLKAKWLFTYMNSKKDDWDFSLGWLCYELSEWIKAIRSGLKELEKEWFLLRKRINSLNWSFEYEWYLFIEPKPSQPHSHEGHALEGYTQNGYGNKERYKKQDIKNNIYNKEKNIKKEKESFGNTEQLENELFGNSEQLKQETIPVDENSLIQQTSEMMVVGNPDIPLKKWYQLECEVIDAITALYKSYGYFFSPGKNSIHSMRNWLRNKSNIELANQHSKTPKELLLGAIKCKFEINKWIENFVTWNENIVKLLWSFVWIYNAVKSEFEKEKIIRERKNIVFGR